MTKNEIAVREAQGDVSRAFIGFETRSQIMQTLASDPVIRRAMECITNFLVMLRGGGRPEIDLDKFANRYGVNSEVLSLLSCLFGRAGDYDEKTLVRVKVMRRLAAALHEAPGGEQTAQD